MSIKKFLTGVAAVAAFSAAGIGYVHSAKAATDNLTVNAVIIEPLAITCATALNFGSIDANGGGSVTVDSAGVSGTTGPILIAATGLQAGQCTTTGEGNFTYTVDIADAIGGVTSGANSMDVINFVVDDGVAGEGAATGYVATLAAGAGTLDIGAELVVGAGQAPGIYTGTVAVDVLYQ